MKSQLSTFDKGSITEKEPLSPVKTGKSQAELFNNVAVSIRNAYEGNMSEEESRRLARNFIKFCQRLIEIQVRIEREKDKEKKE